MRTGCERPERKHPSIYILLSHLRLYASACHGGSFTKPRSVVHQVTGYRSPSHGASFTKSRGIVHQVTEHRLPSHGASVTKSRSIVHQVTEHRLPSHGVSFTKSRSIVHQVTEYRLPSHGVSFTKSRSIVHHVTECRSPSHVRNMDEVTWIVDGKTIGKEKEFLEFIEPWKKKKNLVIQYVIPLKWNPDIEIDPGLTLRSLELMRLSCSEICGWTARARIESAPPRFTPWGPSTDSGIGTTPWMEEARRRRFRVASLRCPRCRV